MSLHVVLEFESLVTDRTLILVRRIVLIHMVFQEMCAFECLTTNVASVFVIVSQQVFHQILLARQVLVAYHTLEGGSC